MECNVVSGYYCIFQNSVPEGYLAEFYSLDRNIQIRALIIDADPTGAGRLSSALSKISNVIINKTASIFEGYKLLHAFDPNLIFIDLVSTGVRDSVTLVQHVRVSRPKIVFVLYCKSLDLHEYGPEIYVGWGSRLRHYFLLPKETASENFEEILMFNLMRVQLDFYAYGVYESLSRPELTEGASALSKAQLSKLSSQVTQISRELASLVRHQDARTGDSQGEKAFVIMAFTDSLKDVYELGIKECLNVFRLNAYRIDEHYPINLIIQQIYEDIHQSRLVIAELTDPRPNCYFELGFAEGLGKPIIRLAKAGTQIPFDVNQYPFIFYSSVVDLRQRLTSTLKELGLPAQ